MARDKEKKRLANKIYRLTHKEESNAYKIKWREGNPDYHEIYDKTYYQVHKEEIKLRHKAYRKKNRDKIKAYDQKRKEDTAIRCKKWAKANVKKVRMHSHERRAYIYKTQIEDINEKQVFIRDGWICQHCKKKVNKKLKFPNHMCASLDHIVPLSKGGKHIYANVQLAHFICNMIKRNTVLPQGEQLRIF